MHHPRLDTKKISSKRMSELRASYPCRSSGKESGDIMHDMFMIIINIMQSSCPHWILSSLRWFSFILKCHWTTLIFIWVLKESLKCNLYYWHLMKSNIYSILVLNVYFQNLCLLSAQYNITIEHHNFIIHILTYYFYKITLICVLLFALLIFFLNILMSFD